MYIIFKFLIIRSINTFCSFVLVVNLFPPLAVPCGINDVKDCEAIELHPSDPKHTAARPAKSPAVHPTGHGARVAFL